jgi:hypothetical protein
MDAASAASDSLRVKLFFRNLDFVAREPISLAMDGDRLSRLPEERRSVVF